MITINYQRFGNKGFQLRLRLYQDGETKFINVTKLLKGAIQKKHWNQQKQLFVPSCPFSAENNYILVQFRQKYDEMAINWNGSVFGMIAAMENESDEAGGMTLKKYIQVIIGRLNERKHADGTIKGSFEGYEKLERRIQEFCKAKKIKYDKILVSDITPGFVEGILTWVEKSRKGKGRIYISKMLHAVISKADTDSLLKVDDF